MGASGNANLFWYIDDGYREYCEEKYNTVSDNSSSNNSSSDSSPQYEKFTLSDVNYYKLLSSDNSINRVDLMNSNRNNYLEYLKSGSEYSNHVGFSRSYLTFSYSQLKRLFRIYFEDGTVPFFYGNSLGYNTYTDRSEIIAGVYSSERFTSGTDGGSISSSSSMGSLEKDPNKKNILIIAGHFTGDREVPGTPGLSYTEAQQNRIYTMELAGAIQAAGMNPVIANRVLAHEKGAGDYEDEYGIIWGDEDVYTTPTSKVTSLFNGYDHVIEVHHNATENIADKANGALLIQTSNFGVTDLDKKLLQCIVNNNQGNTKNGTITQPTKNISTFYKMGVKMTYLEVEFYNNKEAMDIVTSNYNKIAIEMAMVLREHFGVTTPMNTNDGGAGTSSGTSSYEWDTGGLKTYNYDELEGEEVEFTLSFYCAVDNSIEGGALGTHSNPLVFGNVASNYWSDGEKNYGRKIYLQGVGMFTVEDTGSDPDFKKKNRIDIFVKRREGESDRNYEARTNGYGHIVIKGKALPKSWNAHQHANPDI